LTVYSPSSIFGVSVGVSGSYDLKNAIFGAKILGIRLQECLITKNILLETIDELKHMNIIQNINDLSIAIPLFLGMQVLAKNSQIRNVFLGQGADELFGGYQKYIKSLYEKGDDITNKMMLTDYNSLIYHQILTEQRIADKFGLTPVYPFLTPQIVTYAQSQSISSHIVFTSKGNFIRKALLRNLAKRIGLPNKIVNQPKKAIQYGSGTINLLRKVVKSNGYDNIPIWFQEYFQNNINS
jgi:asparagine synthase (glutamine-hydrolysing)